MGIHVFGGLHPLASPLFSVTHASWELTNHIALIMAADCMVLASIGHWLPDVYLPHCPILAPRHKNVCKRTIMSVLSSKILPRWTTPQYQHRPATAVPPSVGVKDCARLTWIQDSCSLHFPPVMTEGLHSVFPQADKPNLPSNLHIDQICLSMAVCNPSKHASMQPCTVSREKILPVCHCRKR